MIRFRGINAGRKLFMKSFLPAPFFQKFLLLDIQVFYIAYKRACCTVTNDSTF